mmetsp:Transcript_43318/g.70296  ORF Transcript_43318/g.70296 Transcript_43318/m.70296 type:complete len:204 (-) Transcript_43318:226-837(-)
MLATNSALSFIGSGGRVPDLLSCPLSLQRFSSLSCSRSRFWGQGESRLNKAVSRRTGPSRTFHSCCEFEVPEFELPAGLNGNTNQAALQTILREIRAKAKETHSLLDENQRVLQEYKALVETNKQVLLENRGVLKRIEAEKQETTQILLQNQQVVDQYIELCHENRNVLERNERVAKELSSKLDETDKRIWELGKEARDMMEQ